MDKNILTEQLFPTTFFSNTFVSILSLQNLLKKGNYTFDKIEKIYKLNEINKFDDRLKCIFYDEIQSIENIKKFYLLEMCVHNTQ